jgi:agmatine/peptidylarginine deiminase
MIPTTGNDMETYMNTLYVNGTIFVPQMGIGSDAAALRAYSDLGLKAVGVNTKQLADMDQGNIHCLTMNYPPGAFVPSEENASLVKFAEAN